jgi:hypothetical protein
MDFSQFIEVNFFQVGFPFVEVVEVLFVWGKARFPDLLIEIKEISLPYGNYCIIFYLEN